MRKKLILTLLTLLLTGTVFAQGTQPQPGSDGLGDQYYPLLGNGGYDAQHYTIDLSWDATTNTIAGTVTMDATATQDLSAFNLDFQGFTISSLKLNGIETPYTRATHEMTISPAQPLAKGQSFETVIAYSGIPGKGVAGYDATFAGGWTQYPGGVYTSSEPDGASYWYPVNDHPLDKATYTIDITVPDKYVVAANGLLQDVKENADATKTYDWNTTNPVASYLVTVDIGDFKIQTAQGPHGLPIRNYFPTDLNSTSINAFAHLPDMIDFYEHTFGAYPFEAAGVVVADTDLGFALETQTMILFGNTVGVHDSQPEVVVAHELAHQWFGDSVSLVQWKDIWLNEGFATYASMLWLEHSQGRAVMDATMAQYYSAIANPRSHLVPPGDPPGDDLFNNGVYLRGAWTLHALRLLLGDDVFFKILQTYYGRYKYGNATTQDFINVAQEVSGQNLMEFFNAWLFASQLPPPPASI